MKKLACIILVLISLYTNAQSDTTQLPRNDTMTQQVSTDTVTSYLDQGTKDQLARGMDSFMRMQQERNRQQKKQAIIRIVIGVVFAAIFVIGMLRRRKK